MATIFQQLRRLGSAMKEKPTATIEDYVLEHFMLYHGLVGTTPENQRDFRDVRMDIVDAIDHGSCVEMGIALKLPPLLWEDRLEKIIAECLEAREKAAIVAALLAQGDTSDKPPEYDPLKHPDWRVRANAAKLLAFVQATEAIPRMVLALNDDDEAMRASFCHIAYALAKFNTPQVRTALSEHFYDEEPWFRVDAVGALAGWPLSQVNFDLMKAMLSPHELTDYAAVVISKKHPPSELLAQKDEQLQDGALEVIIGLVEAARGTFKTDSTADFGIEACLPRVLELAKDLITPRRIRAALMLSRFVQENSASVAGNTASTDMLELKRQADDAVDRFGQPDTQTIVLETLKGNGPPGDPGQLRHAVLISGLLKINRAAPYIVPLLQLGSPMLNDVLDTVAILGAPGASSRIVGLIHEVVDLDERTGKNLNKQAVFEDDPQASKIYWHALKALGHVSDNESIQCLIKATHDFAADKRQQAVLSLTNIFAAEPDRRDLQEIAQSTINEALKDPAASVKITAARAVAELKLLTLITDVARLTSSRESGVSRQAFDSLRQLSKSGFKKEVDTAVDAAMTAERDSFRKQTLGSFKKTL